MMIIVMSEHDNYSHGWTWWSWSRYHVLKVGDLFDCRPAINRAFHHCKNVANKGKNKVNKCFFSEYVFNMWTNILVQIYWSICGQGGQILYILVCLLICRIRWTNVCSPNIFIDMWTNMFICRYVEQMYFTIHKVVKNFVWILLICLDLQVDHRGKNIEQINFNLFWWIYLSDGSVPIEISINRAVS